jgi:Holliday junction resolvase
VRKQTITVDLDSSARLIYEAIQQLGWSAEPTLLVDRVKRLDLGLPAEDEFIFILSWLGKCSLVHKRDQRQFPPESTNHLQVPDLLASFETKSGKKEVLVEVKVSNKKKLVWKPDYLNKLKNYASRLHLPLLIAWRFHSLWNLVDINCFLRARTNFHLSVETAMKNNLMSYLAGDFVYIMKPNVGLHFIMRKERLLSKKDLNENCQEENWLVRITEAFFTNSEGRKASRLPSGFWPLFISAEPEPKDIIKENVIHQSFIIPESQGMKFAHCALPILINFSVKDNDKIHWRKQLEEHKYPVEIKQFYMAAQKGIEEGYVKYILRWKPAYLPDFLKDIENAEQPN